MSIPIVKGVEFGLGFEQTRRFGSAVMDVIEGRDAAGAWGRRIEQRGRTGGRHLQRPADRRQGRGQADLDAASSPAVGRPHHRPAGREGPLRAQRHLRRAGGRRRCRGHGLPDPGRRRPRQVRRRFAGRDARQPGPISRADREEPPRRRRPRPAHRRRDRPQPRARAARPLPKASKTVDLVLVGLPGSGKSAVGTPARRSAQRHFHRPRRADRAAGRASPCLRSSPKRARQASAATNARPSISLGPADPDPELRRVDRHRRRRRHRPAQPLAALPRPLPRLARRRARDPRRPPRPGAPTCARSSPATTPSATLRQLAEDRRRFYAPALQISGAAHLDAILRTLEEHIGEASGPGGNRASRRHGDRAGGDRLRDRRHGRRLAL